MMELWGIISTALAVAGVLLNNHLDRRCFYFWIVSNLISAVLHIGLGVWSLAARDVIFLLLAVHGRHKWKKLKDKK